MNDWFTIDKIDTDTYIISLDIQPEILIRMREEFTRLKSEGKLHHGSGTFDYGDWGVWL